MPRKATAIQPRVTDLYDKIQAMKKSHPDLTRPQICKKLKVSMAKFSYATTTINRAKGIDGRRKEATVLPPVRIPRSDVTVMDLSKMQERMPDMGRNAPAIVVMTDAYTAFSWMTSMMKGH